MARTIQIRHVPDELHRALRARAAAADKSLSDYLLDEIVRAAAYPSVAEVLERARVRALANPRMVSGDDVVEAIRSGRDE